MSENLGEIDGALAGKGRCPLCGAEASQGPECTFAFLGHVHAFCSQACKERFARRPEQFIAQLAHEYGGHLGYSCPRDAA